MDKDSNQPDDERRGLTSTETAISILESLSIILPTEELLKNSRHIVNLFAGEANESAATFALLDSVGNINCEVTAVDKHRTQTSFIIDKLTKNFPNRFHFEVSDAFTYLKQVKPDSLDAITAFGSEYVFWNDTTNQKIKDFASLALGALKPGGVLIIFALKSEHYEYLTKNGFTQLITGIFQKQ